MSTIEERTAYLENPILTKTLFGDFSPFYVTIAICTVLCVFLFVLNIIFCCCSKHREYWQDRHTGTRARMPEFKRCNLGKVKANAVVARGGNGYNETEINAFINLFTYAQQFFGRRDADDFSFSMFYSVPPYHDLIFQDATRQLQIIQPALRRYDLYLGNNYMRARRITDCQKNVSKLP